MYVNALEATMPKKKKCRIQPWAEGCQRVRLRVRTRGEEPTTKQGPMSSVAKAWPAPGYMYAS